MRKCIQENKIIEQNWEMRIETGTEYSHFTKKIEKNVRRNVGTRMQEILTE